MRQIAAQGLGRNLAEVSRRVARRSGQGGARAALRCGGLAALLLICGCGASAGAWYYHLGMVPPEQVKAQCQIPPGPVLILVDDNQDLVQPPTARQMLVDSLARKLKEHGITDRVTTNEELARVRQSDRQFEQRGAREVGRMVGADTVLWINIHQYAIDRDLEMAVSPAQWVVNLKVVNAKAEKREEVRIWPLDREGKFVDVSVPPQELHKCKSRSEVYEKMADALADKIARFFYDHTAEMP